MLTKVHGVVSDMAVENADLVETTFIIDYLNAIKHEGRRLDKDKTESFVDMFRTKCQEEQVEKYVCDHMVQALPALEVAKAYAVPELDVLLMRKWADGDRCVTALLELFHRC